MNEKLQNYKMRLLFVCILMLGLVGVKAQTDPGTANLMHQWTFTDGTANDIASGVNGAGSGGVNGTLSGTSATITNRALQLTGSGTTGGYLSLSGSALALNGYTGGLTFEAWETSTNTGTGNPMLFYFGNAQGAQGVFNTTVSRAAIKNASTEQSIGGTGANSNGLHHLVTVLNSTTMYFYVDGILNSQVTLGSGNSIAMLGTTLAYLGHSGYTTDNTWTGTIHKFSIYNKSLSAAEVQYLYLIGEPIVGDYRSKAATGSGATASATVTNGVVTGVTVSGGSSYTAAVVVVTGSTGGSATFPATVSGGAVTAANVATVIAGDNRNITGTITTTVTPAVLWSTAGSWETLGSDGTWSTASVAPASTNNVSILSGHTMVISAAANCNDLHVAGTLSAVGFSTTVSGATTIDAGGVLAATGLVTNGNVTINGTLRGTTAGTTTQDWRINNTVTVTVGSTGILGGASIGASGESIALLMFPTGNTITVTGSGIVNIGACYPWYGNTSGYTATFDIDANINYSTGSFAAFTLQNGAGGTVNRFLNVNAGRTVKLTQSNGYFHCTSAGGFNTSGGNMYYNINGTLDVSNAKYILAGSNSGGKVLQCNLGSAGKLMLGSTVTIAKPYAQTPSISASTAGATIEFDGSTAPTFNTSTYFPTSISNLIINNTGGIVNLPSSLSTTTLTNLTINAGSKLTLNSATTATTVTINSDATNGTGTLLDGGFLTNTNATVNQNLSSIRNWYMSSPLTNAVAPAGYTYYQYNEPGDNLNPTGLATAYWKTVNTGDAFEKGRGYIALPASVATPFTFTTSTGSLTTGDVPVNLTRTTGKTKEGFNLIGNPYPSYVNIDAFVSGDIDPSYWYRTRNQAGSAWTFDTYNIPSTLGTGLSGLAVSANIPPMQAFWVRVKNTKSAATLTFTNAMRGHQDNSNNKFRAPSAVKQQVLRLQVSNGTQNDEALVYFNANASDGYDMYDSPKMSNGSASIPEIYTVVDNEQLVINGLNSISPDKALPFGFTTGTANSFTLKATEFSNFDTDTRVILRDNLLNMEQDITDGIPYNFGSEISSTNTRFSIIFRSAGSTTATPTINDSNSAVVIYKNANNQIVIHCPENRSSDAIVNVYNSLGQKLQSKLLVSSNTIIEATFTPGVYVVTINNAGKISSQKLILY